MKWEREWIFMVKVKHYCAGGTEAAMQSIQLQGIDPIKPSSTGEYLSSGSLATDQRSSLQKSKKLAMKNLYVHQKLSPTARMTTCETPSRPSLGEVGTFAQSRKVGNQSHI